MAYQITNGYLTSTDSDNDSIIKGIKTIVVSDSRERIVFYNGVDYVVKLKDTIYSTMAEFRAAAEALVGVTVTDSLDLSVSTTSDSYLCADDTIAFEIESSVNDTVTVLQSLSGTNWVTAVDSAGDDITLTLIAGTPDIINLSDVPNGSMFKLSFTSVTGTVEITVI